MKRLLILVLVACAQVPLKASCALRGGEKHMRQYSWKSKQNKLFLNDQEFRLKGISWNGFESVCNVAHGLWLHSLQNYLDILQDQKFNALRLPLSFEIMEELDTIINADCTTKESEIFPGMTVRQYMGPFLDHLSARGISVLFDMHTIDGQITEFPWTDNVSEDRVVAAWVQFAQAFGKHPAVMGFEIKNEPHGDCSTYEFHRHCARVIDSIGDRFAGLYFIDGTTQSSTDKPPWGGTFESISRTCADDPLCQNILQGRLVFSPHVYGPDVRGDDARMEGDEIFEKRFGFLKYHPFFGDSAIIVTEFGGHMLEEDGRYFVKWKEYMERVHLSTGAFFWTFPPSSLDTGGMLDDNWSSVNQGKSHFLTTIQPTPSTIC